VRGSLTKGGQVSLYTLTVSLFIGYNLYTVTV
jgi:hypothetical protein